MIYVVLLCIQYRRGNLNLYDNGYLNESVHAVNINEVLQNRLDKIKLLKEIKEDYFHLIVVWPFNHYAKSSDTLFTLSRLH